MTEPSPGAPFRGLPTELKDHIFAFIRMKVDQRSVCLVNREWNALMAPSFWEILETTLEPTPSRSLTVLLQPQNRILSNVKHILVRKGPVRKAGWNESIEATLLSLITVLPENSLRFFGSHYLLPPSCLLHLLQSQQRLERLVVKLDSADPIESGQLNSLTQAPWIAPSLGHIKTLTAFVSPAIKPQNDDFRFLIKNAKSLETLKVNLFPSERSLSYRSKYPWDDEDVFTIPKLSRLDLQFVHLQACSPFLKHVDFSFLTSLRFVSCQSDLSFLQTLARYYSQRPCNLAKLEISLKLRHSGGPIKETHQALEHLLYVLPPHRHLKLDAGNDRLVSTACLLRHGTMLQSLCLSAEHTTAKIYLSLSDLTTILRACPHLQQLAIALCLVDLGSIEDFGANFTLGSNTAASAQAELEAMLDIIASVPTIHTLRILTLPVIDYRQPALAAHQNYLSETQATMQRYATQVIAYLVECGSKVKLLAVKPIWRVIGRRVIDGNGHYWPNYYYTRSWSIDDEGVQHVSARPLARPDLNMPESTILDDEA